MIRCNCTAPLAVPSRLHAPCSDESMDTVAKATVRLLRAALSHLLCPAVTSPS
jgi:hypothetical protein